MISGFCVARSAAHIFTYAHMTLSFQIQLGPDSQSGSKSFLIEGAINDRGWGVLE